MKDPLDSPEDAIIESWHVNAGPWTRALQAQSIESRRLVTDEAIVTAVCGVRPRRVLDVGCGEGWLARALDAAGIAVVGIDAVPALIAQARRGCGDFHVLTYQDVADGRLALGYFDAVVCNFSLLGDASAEALIGALAGCLTAPGYCIVQTLHPVAACGGRPYRDGWRVGSWAGFDADFSQPAPWFFRTVGTWYAMLRRCGYEVIECREPVARDASTPSSLMFICRLSGTAARV